MNNSKELQNLIEQMDKAMERLSPYTRNRVLVEGIKRLWTEITSTLNNVPEEYNEAWMDVIKIIETDNCNALVGYDETLQKLKDKGYRLIAPQQSSIIPEHEKCLDKMISKVDEMIAIVDEHNAKVEQMSTDELLIALSKVEYKAHGFPAIILWKMLGVVNTDKWDSKLRNPAEWENLPDFSADTPRESLQKLYNYCKEKKYL